MNRILEELKIPGFKVRTVIVPREENDKKHNKGHIGKSVQLEFDMFSNS